jgi:hypothetical protein
LIAFGNGSFTFVRPTAHRNRSTNTWGAPAGRTYDRLCGKLDCCKHTAMKFCNLRHCQYHCTYWVGWQRGDYLYMRKNKEQCPESIMFCATHKVITGIPHMLLPSGMQDTCRLHMPTALHGSCELHVISMQRVAETHLCSAAGDLILLAQPCVLG